MSQDPATFEPPEDAEPAIAPGIFEPGSAGVEDEQHGAADTPGRTPVRAPEWTVQVLKTERSVFELHRQWKAGRLVLQPEFQRAFIWDPRRQVRLVESVLARIMLPAVYLSDEAEERSLVIDGHQRLFTLFQYLDNAFALSGLTLLPQHEGLRFKDLDARFQRRIEDAPITVFSVQPGSSPLVKFHQFERLNQGGIALSAQEVRNGIFQGPGLKLIKELVAPSGLFRNLVHQRRFHRMKADELVLRGMAFVEFREEDYPGDMASFLTNALVKLNEMTEREHSEVLVRWVTGLGCSSAIFGKEIFRRFDPDTRKPGRPINAALMDAMLWGFCQVDRPREWWRERKAVVRDALIEKHRDPAFRDAITYATGMTSRVRYRLNSWTEVLEDVARNHP